MKVNYYPGGPNGTVGKKYKVEIIEISLIKAKHVDRVLLREVRIKYEDGKKEWVEGNDFFSKVANCKIVDTFRE